MHINDSKQELGLLKKYWGLAVTIIVLTSCGYFLGKHVAKSQLEKSETAIQSAKNLLAENQKLSEQLNQVLIEKDVLKLSLDKNKALLAESIEKELSLKEKINFYQRVMAPEMTEEGFAIDRAELNKGLGTNSFELKLMMLQHENIKAVIKGKLELKIVGSLDGKTHQINVASIIDNPEEKLSFAFKYFQVLSIDLSLPQEFIPTRLEVSTDIYKYKRKRGTYNTQFSWQDILAEEA